MEMHQLEYVLAVAKYNGFTRAAEEIKTSQSSLSQQISKLENELGISLFARTTRSVQLTPAGKEFLTHAKRIMSEVIEARRCIHEYVSFEKGHISVGVIPIIGHYRIPNLLSSFKNNYPRVTMSLREKQCNELLDLLRESKIDVAFVQQDSVEPPFHFIPVATDQMVVVTSERHPFAARKSVDLLELQCENFIVPPPTSGHHVDFYNACLAAGFEPNILLTCSSVKTILGLVREELGIAVLPANVASADWGLGIKTLLLTPTINEKIFLAVKNNDDVPPSLKVFMEFTSKWINE
ncbi:HTH-type transcriptional regulator CynR [Pelotomaculum sp. FP]|uniref:LysR family transcriptional regulator n=1 Tax=Pelotomaculum sp. FP TaxID=261474 RepID=UPI001066468A|nr:LysR family transcriptional regulator [Pelotomaculum sp. FP]TEB12640.1 HTH-type transcriptional regulator CynR [Pelotomaculum sp. FP]